MKELRLLLRNTKLQTKKRKMNIICYAIVMDLVFGPCLNGVDGLAFEKAEQMAHR